MIKRRHSRRVRVGDITIGGSESVSIQSMTNTRTSDLKATISQIGRLESAGCEIVRVAVKDSDDARAIRALKRSVKIPIAADIHFDYRLAVGSILAGADKVRLNPGNISDRRNITEVITLAKRKGVPIRIGVNSGSLEARLRQGKRDDHVPDAKLLVRSALGYTRLFESLKFRDIIISLKGSDVASTVEAYRAIGKACDYPLHLGITASGPLQDGIVKSSIGIGALLLDGIGDTLRVSLTSDPVEEVCAGQRILSALKLRSFGPEIISCPTCGRCQVDLIKIVNEVDHAMRDSAKTGRKTGEASPKGTRYAIRNSSLSIALMGCEVNGPGEAREADIGIAFGKGQGVLFKKGEIVGRVGAKDAVERILREIRKIETY